MTWPNQKVTIQAIHEISKVIDQMEKEFTEIQLHPMKMFMLFTQRIVIIINQDNQTDELTSFQEIHIYNFLNTSNAIENSLVFEVAIKG